MSRPHRLLHVFSTFAAGGPQVRTTDILNRLPGDFEHVIVAMDDDFEAKARLEADTPVTTLSPPPRGSSLGAPRRLARFIKAQKPDLVLTYNWGATESIAGARLAGVRRVIHAEDGFGPDEAEGQKARRIWARRVLFKALRKLVVPSRRLYEVALRDWKAGEGKTLYIPNGIDLEQFCPADSAAAKLAAGLDPAVPAIGTVAKLRAEKALNLLLESFVVLRRQRPAVLILVGEGPERERLRGKAEELGVGEDVRFPGQLSDPAPILQALDLFALSSITEQMPISVVEAMGCGLPVVSTDVGDVRSMVEESCRPYVRAHRDPEDFGAAFAELLENPDERRAIGAAQRARCEQEFDQRSMVERYEALYREVLSS